MWTWLFNQRLPSTWHHPHMLGKPAGLRVHWVAIDNIMNFLVSKCGLFKLNLLLLWSICSDFLIDRGLLYVGLQE